MMALTDTQIVRFGSKADMCGAKANVRFTPESGHHRQVRLLPNFSFSWGLKI
jgi:hypothetical protein